MGATSGAGTAYPYPTPEFFDILYKKSLKIPKG
jgi:hypothetical protein